MHFDLDALGFVVAFLGILVSSAWATLQILTALPRFT